MFQIPDLPLQNDISLTCHCKIENPFMSLLTSQAVKCLCKYPFALAIFFFLSLHLLTPPQLPLAVSGPLRPREATTARKSRHRR